MRRTRGSNEMFETRSSTVNRLTDNSNLSLIRLFSTVITKKNATEVHSKAEMLLGNGVNVNACDCNNETALHKISHSIPRVKKSKLVIPAIKLLLNFNADTNILNNHGKTCWEIAYENHSIKIGNLLSLNFPRSLSEPHTLDEVDSFHSITGDAVDSFHSSTGDPRHLNRSYSYGEERYNSIEVDVFRNATAPPLHQHF